MGRLPWRKNKVFAVETRPRLWAIGQMLEDPYVAFYDIFSRKPAEENVDLRKCGILFVCPVLRQFIGASNTVRLSLVPRKSIKVPKRWIDPHLPFWGADDQMVVFKGTKHERRITMWPGARLIEKGRGRFSEDKEIVADLDEHDETLIDSHEVVNIRSYPELNERLYLCYKLRKNVDPFKDMILRRPIPLIYKRYVDIAES